jgi:hypothetical protein
MQLDHDTHDRQAQSVAEDALTPTPARVRGHRLDAEVHLELGSLHNDASALRPTVAIQATVEVARGAVAEVDRRHGRGMVGGDETSQPSSRTSTG